MADIHNVLHQLVDAARLHSESQVREAHDAIDAHAQGKSLEQYRKDQAAALAAASPNRQAEEDAVLERAAQIQAQRAAAAEQQAVIAQKEQAMKVARPAPPVAVAETPASPTAEPDAAPTL